MDSSLNQVVARAEQVRDPWFQVLWCALTREERSKIRSLPSASEELLDDLSLQLDLDPLALTMRVCLLRDWRFDFQPACHPVQWISAATIVSLNGKPAYLTSNPFDSALQELLDGTPWFVVPLSRLRMLSDAQKTLAQSPAPIDPTPATQKGTSTQNAAAAAVHGSTVLVIDDDPGFAEVLRRFLNREGYGAHCVSSLDQALRFLKSEAPKVELIICDVHLSGDEEAFESSAIFPEVAALQGRGALPVIMLTSDTSTETKVRYLRSGAKILLNKQCDPRLITAYVRRFTRVSTEQNSVGKEMNRI